MQSRFVVGSFAAFWMILLLLSPAIGASELAKGADGKLEYEVSKGVDLTDILNGSARAAAKETIYGKLSLPDNLEKPVPAVVILHASGGVFDWRELKMAKLLNEAGIAAFVPYSFKARGFSDTKNTQGTGTTFGMRVADALGALQFLAGHPDIDASRIGVMGYSSGGFGSLFTLDDNVRKGLVDGDLKFAAHVNVYASPMLPFKQPKPTSAPVLFLIGEADDLCPKDLVLDYARQLQAAGANVKTIVYPDAHHVFDSPNKVKKFSMDNDGMCQFQVQESGLLLDSATGEQFPEREIYADDGKHIKPCKTDKVTFGKNSDAEKQYKKDVVEFFVQTLKP